MLLDLEKTIKFRKENPKLFGVIVALLIGLCIYCWLATLSGITQDSVTLLSKKSQIIDKANSPTAYYFGFLFNIFLSSFASYYSYLIIFRTKP